MAAQLEIQSDALKLYELIIQTSNFFLHNCKSFSIEILQLEDPSYEAVAHRATLLAGLIRVLSEDFDPIKEQNAVEYCELMTKMAVAINESDKVGLSKLITQLERRSGL